MTDEWSLRDEIRAASLRWPGLVIFCLVGSLIGLAISFVWPSPHRATKELYVGLEVNQAADSLNPRFSNIDDYKNWQMASLNSLIYMDPIIDETMNHLQGTDPYWSSVTRQQLANMLHAYWRNAGKWRLVAESDDPQRAAQAVAAWEEVVVERVHDAVAESQNTLVLDHQLQSIASVQVQAISQATRLIHVHDMLQIWQTSDSQSIANRPLEETERSLLWQQLAQAGLGPSWDSLLSAFPSPSASSEQYRDWLADVITGLDQEIRTLEAQIEALEVEKEETSTRQSLASQQSLGLSANLKVDKITDAQPEQSIVRPTGLLVLIGAVLGFILWVILQLAGISTRAKR